VKTHAIQFYRLFNQAVLLVIPRTYPAQHRKVAEGKNKMSLLNAVKSKLLARVVACVNNNRLYVDNYQKAA
jgi:hypothetical protein